MVIMIGQIQTKVSFYQNYNVAESSFDNFIDDLIWYYNTQKATLDPAKQGT